MSKQVGQMPGASAYLDMRTVNGTRCYGVRGTKWNLVERDQQTGEFNRDRGLTVTENCLSSNPEAAAIVAANDDMALGAIEAVQARGLDIPIIGFDALPESLKAIQDGALYGTVEQFPGGQARTALQTITAFITDGATPENEINLLSPILISADNLDQAERFGEVE